MYDYYAKKKKKTAEIILLQFSQLVLPIRRCAAYRRPQLIQRVYNNWYLDRYNLFFLAPGRCTAYCNNRTFNTVFSFKHRCMQILDVIIIIIVIIINYMPNAAESPCCIQRYNIEVNTILSSKITLGETEILSTGGRPKRNNTRPL